MNKAVHSMIFPAGFRMELDDTHKEKISIDSLVSSNVGHVTILEVRKQEREIRGKGRRKRK